MIWSQKKKWYVISKNWGCLMEKIIEILKKYKVKDVEIGAQDINKMIQES